MYHCDWLAIHLRFTCFRAEVLLPRKALGGKFPLLSHEDETGCQQRIMMLYIGFDVVGTWYLQQENKPYGAW